MPLRIASGRFVSARPERAAMPPFSNGRTWSRGALMVLAAKNRRSVGGASGMGGRVLPDPCGVEPARRTAFSARGDRLHLAPARDRQVIGRVLANVPPLRLLFLTGAVGGDTGPPMTGRGRRHPGGQDLGDQLRGDAGRQRIMDRRALDFHAFFGVRAGFASRQLFRRRCPVTFSQLGKARCKAPGHGKGGASPAPWAEYDQISHCRNSGHGDRGGQHCGKCLFHRITPLRAMTISSRSSGSWILAVPDAGKAKARSFPYSFPYAECHNCAHARNWSIKRASGVGPMVGDDEGDNPDGNRQRRAMAGAVDCKGKWRQSSRQDILKASAAGRTSALPLSVHRAGASGLPPSSHAAGAARTKAPRPRPKRPEPG